MTRQLTVGWPALPLQVVFLGLDVVVPLISLELLKIPKLCRLYFQLLGYLLELFPERMDTLPGEPAPPPPPPPAPPRPHHHHDHHHHVHHKFSTLKQSLDFGRGSILLARCASWIGMQPW